MQFTVLANKLTRLSVAEFTHEFRTVHARDTKEAAASLGLITEYIQGLYLPSAIQGATQLANLPLPEHPGPYQSFAQLSWPSVTVLHGSLQSAGYRASAVAKHEFAVPEHLFLTERLDPDTRHHRLNGLGRPENSGIEDSLRRPVMLIIALTPKPDLDQASFRARWAKHADDVVRPKSTVAQAPGLLYYQRNGVIPLPVERLRAIFTGTQFPAHKNFDSGGYEEFIFADMESAQAFCSQHGETLGRSYEEFCNTQKSWCAGFDYVEHWGPADRGIKQRGVGMMLKLLLTARNFGLFS